MQLMDSLLDSRATITSLDAIRLRRCQDADRRHRATFQSAGVRYSQNPSLNLALKGLRCDFAKRRPPRSRATRLKPTCRRWCDPIWKP